MHENFIYETKTTCTIHYTVYEMLPIQSRK